MSLVRRLRRAVGDTARALPLAREASARVARGKYAQRVRRFLVEQSGIADPRPDGVAYEADSQGVLPLERVADASLPVEALTRAIPRRHHGQVNIAGDRPFMRDDILDVLDVFRTKGYRCDRLTTDGTSLSPARVHALIALAGKGFLQHVAHPVDRAPQVISGLPPAEDGEAGIRTLMQAASRSGEPLRLIATTTVRSETLESLAEAADIARDLGADGVELNHLMFATPDEVDETLRFVGESDRSIIATNVTHDPGIPPTRLRVRVDALRSRCGTLGLQFDQRPDGARRHPRRLLHARGQARRAVPVPVPARQRVVQRQGAVLPLHPDRRGRPGDADARGGVEHATLHRPAEVTARAAVVPGVPEVLPGRVDRQTPAAAGARLHRPLARAGGQRLSGPS